MTDPLKLYRFLLKLYPARFREEYGTPLEQQFSDEYREAGGSLARFGVWMRTLRDLAISIPLELGRELRQDLRYSVRIYSRRPGVTLLAVAAMALAIGATTGVFSVVNALLLRSLPFRAPERMVQLGIPFVPPDSPPAFHAWRSRSNYLEDAAMYSQTEMNLSGAAGSARVRVSETSSNFFSALGREPEIGRGFAADEDVEGKNGVAVISYGLWQQFFGGDPRVLGSTVHLNGQPLTVLGIAPPGLDYPVKTAVWTPSVFNLARIPKSGVVWREVFGRLKPGLTLARAQSMFDADREHLSPGVLKQEGADRVKLIPLREQLAGPVRRASLVLLGAVSFVLLIACANVANLLLTRITERRKELALRASLGASRARLAQQLITESVLLAGLAAAAGMLVAHWAARLATAAQPAQLTAQNYTILDWRVLGFAAGLAVLTGFVFGVLPASLIGRLQPSEDLVRAPSDGSNSSVRRLRSALVALQVALTLVLLGGSIVMGRSFSKMLGADLGYRTDHVITMNVSLAGTRYDKPELRTQYYHDALDRLRKVPGVEAAGGIDALPLATNAFMGIDAELDSSPKAEFSCVMWATTDYFRTMRTDIVAGRDFTSKDQQGAARVAIVNEEFARDAGGSQAVLGHHVKSIFGGSGSGVTIVGVVQTVHYDAGPADKPMPILFLPPDQNPYPFMTLVARVHGRTEAYLPIARDAVQSVGRQVPVFDVKTLDQRLAENLARPRFYTTAVLFFGAFGLLLAVIGVYGVASHSILQRTHELGVRIAIGASAQRMRWMLLRQSLLPVAFGMAAGVAGAFGLGQFLQHLLDTAQRVDGITCAIAAATLAAIASLAVWSATQRILRLDPMQVLRAE
jgi:putative ABC transport system permease protein